MMASFSISLLLIVAFLGLTLVVGLMGSKATTFRAYAVDNKRLSTFKLLASIVGTSLCGWSLRYFVEYSYSATLYQIIPKLFLESSQLWGISLLWVRMAPFMQHLSMPEMIGHAYGKYPRIIAALCCIISSIGLLIVQIDVIYFIIRICIDSMVPETITIWATLVLMAYATVGGIRSVTNTDVLQCITFIAIIFLIAKLMFVKTDKTILEIVSFLHKQGKITFNNLFYPDTKLWQYWLSRFLPYYFLSFFHAVSSPLIIQRVYMCSGPIQVKKVFLYGSFAYFFTLFFAVLIGLFLFSANPTLPVTEVWPYIVASTAPFVRGLVVIGILGFAMSTADSCLHLCSVLVAHDLMESIRKVRPISDKLQIRVAQLTTLIVGLLVMLLVQCGNDLLAGSNHWVCQGLFVYIQHFSDLLLMLTDFCVPLSPLVVLALFGFRGTSCTAFVGMAMGLLFCIFYAKWSCTSMYNFFMFYPVVGILSTLAAHYLLPQPAGKGWVGLDGQQKRLLQLTSAFKKFKKRVDIE